MSGAKVKAGDVFEDQDPRVQIRRVEVVSVNETHAIVRRGGAGRAAAIRLDRLLTPRLFKRKETP